LITGPTFEITGPTFEEMLHPQTMDPAIRAQADAARVAAPLDPINLFNITWREIDNSVAHVVLPHELNRCGSRGTDRKSISLR